MNRFASSLRWARSPVCAPLKIERLDWSEIDLQGGMIEAKAEKTKTASRRLVPILPNLKSWLEPHAKKSGAIWPHSHPFFHERQCEAATGAGLTEWKANGLRHSFISYRLAQVKSAPQVATFNYGKFGTLAKVKLTVDFCDDSAQDWWNFAKEVLLFSYPEPHAIEELNGLVTNNAKRKSPGRAVFLSERIRGTTG